MKSSEYLLYCTGSGSRGSGERRRTVINNNGAAVAAPALTTCVIGLNEAANLPRLLSSLQPLYHAYPGAQCLYVDSHSRDDSVRVAAGQCDLVVRLCATDNASASLARHHGTRHCRGRWILYLDGDMALEPGFVAEIARVITADAPDGLVGDYTDVYPDGGTREKALGRRLRPGPASHFGGAVLLRRQAVLDAGNWNPGLFAWEENELYSRLRAIGARVDYVPVPMVRHHTPRVSRRDRLRGCLTPAAPGVGKKFYGFGQVIAARLRAGTLAGFIRGFPEPFVLWLALLLAVVALVSGALAAALALLAAGAGFVAWRRGPALIIVYGLLPLQLVAGWRRYDPTVVAPSAVEAGRGPDGP